MHKATLTARQIIAALIAGIVGHSLFSAALLALGFALLGGVLASILGSVIAAFTGSQFDPGTLPDFLGSASGVVGAVFVGVAIAGFVVFALAVLFSWLILKAGRVRRPAAVTWWSLLIAFVLDIPLAVLYLAVAGGSDREVPYSAVGFIGTVVVGALVWLWMTWAHRGGASEFAAVSATSAAASAAEVDATGTSPAVEAAATAEPAVDPAVDAAPAAETAASTVETAAEPAAPKEAPPAD